MSDSPQRQLPFQNFGFTAALLALAVSSVVVDGSIPKRSAANVDPGQVMLSPASSLETRTWEDPLTLVRAIAALDSGEKQPIDIVRSGQDSAAKRFWSHFPDECGLLVMPVLLPTGKHQEMVEFRMRTRTAIHAAFSTSGWTCPGELAVWDFPDLQQSIALEFFERPELLSATNPANTIGGSDGQVQARHAVIVWVDLDSMPVDFAGSMDTLLFSLLDRLSSWQSEYPNQLHSLVSQAITVHAVGPQTSNDLINLAAKSAALNKLNTPWLLQRKLFSPWATIDDEVALTSLPAKTGEGSQTQTLSEVFKRRTGWNLERTTSTDRVLRTALIDEAKRRSADRGIRVALLTENNSVYGRTWFDELNKEGSGNEFEPGMVFSSGIDGSVPRALKSEVEALANDIASDYPKGRGQVDYIKRHPILQRRAPMLDAERKPPALFLGLFATEVPDKIALAYASRFARPDAFLFTSDLDSRFFHGKHNAVMRNTVIASHFGLSLNEDLQRSLPPFRGSYQTASYFAALRALGETDPLPQDHAPLLFEIGHDRAFLLSTKSPGTTRSVHPEIVDVRKSLVGQRQTLLSVLIVIGLLLFLALRRESVEQSHAATMSLGVWLILAIASSTAAIRMTEFALNQQHLDGEPLTWLGGVSVWPAEYLRLIGCTLGVGFLFILRQRYFQVMRKIEAQWPDLQRPVGGTAIHQLSSDWRRFRRNKGSRRLPLQVIVATLLVVLLVFLLRELLGGGVAPIRGDKVAVFDQRMRDFSKLILGLLIITTGLLFRDLRWLFHNLRKHKMGVAESTGKSEIWVRWIEMRSNLLITLSSRLYGAVYYSGTVLLFIVLGRSNYFDRWSWSWTQLSLLAAAGGGVLMLAYSLRMSARRLRESMIAQAGDCMEFLSQQPRSAAVLAERKRVVRARRELEAAASGALASTWNDPVLRALLVPISGMGAFELLYSGLLPT